MADNNIELRGPCPREIVDVIDGWALAKRINRTEAVNRILRAWAMEKMHEHSVIDRVTRGNPPLEEVRPTATERAASRAGADSTFGSL